MNQYFWSKTFDLLSAVFFHRYLQTPLNSAKADADLTAFATGFLMTQAIQSACFLKPVTL
jgi:hypothetical protein